MGSWIAETLIVPQWNQWNKFACCCCTKYPRKFFTPEMLWNTWSSCWDIHFFPLNSWGTKFLNNNKAPTKLGHQKLLYKKPFTQIERKKFQSQRSTLMQRRNKMLKEERCRQAWRKVRWLSFGFRVWALLHRFYSSLLLSVVFCCCCCCCSSRIGFQDYWVLYSIQLASHRFCELFKNQEKHTEEHFVHGFWCCW